MSQKGRSKQVQPAQWTEAQLEEARLRSIGLFRDERVKEPLEKYLEAFEEYRDSFETLLETTVDLTQIYDHIVPIFSDKKLLHAFRYLASPRPPPGSTSKQAPGQSPRLAFIWFKAKSPAPGQIRALLR